MNYYGRYGGPDMEDKGKSGPNIEGEGKRGPNMKGKEDL